MKQPKHNHPSEIALEFISNLINYILYHSPDITYESLSRSVLHHVPNARFNRINDTFFDVRYADTTEYLQCKLPGTNSADESVI